MTLLALPRIAEVLSRKLMPRRPPSVSAWADAERVLSTKGSAKPGRWRTDSNPPLREPMDCMSARSGVRDVVLMFPIQDGKTEVALNTVGYCMDQHPGPVMVCLPGEVSLVKWVAQKLSPMLEETPAVRRALTSVASRDAANTRTLKEFDGGQLYIEHAGSPSRLKSTSVRTLIVDELDEFAGNFVGGDDPVDMLDGRTSAFPSTYKRLYISTPQMRGTSRIERKFLEGDQRRYYVPCPHCAHEQPLEWKGLMWTPDASHCWYACRECGAVIDEHHKTAMINAGRWVAENPNAREGVRSYTLNCLYYPFGLGPRWLDLVRMWLAAQNDPSRLKTFINDRLAEPFEDPAMRAVKHNVLRDRGEPYRLRTAPLGVLACTAGVDTQDNRLAVHVVGWGRGMRAWTLDYVELPGDPAEDLVWISLVELLTRPIEHECGALIRPEATAIDAGGHRTEAVKSFCRPRVGGHPLRRVMPIFGAVPNNAPVLSKGKLQDINWRGQYDKNGVTIFHVGTVGIKHHLYSLIAADDGKPVESRMIHVSDELPPEFFAGLVSETYDPNRNRFIKRNGVRNEPLDTWDYAYAAAHHPELRLHRRSKADWDAAEARLLAAVGAPVVMPVVGELPPPVSHGTSTQTPKGSPRAGWKRTW